VNKVGGDIPESAEVVLLACAQQGARQGEAQSGGQNEGEGEVFTCQDVSCVYIRTLHRASGTAIDLG
jgi:hypothetical protein